MKKLNADLLPRIDSEQSDSGITNDMALMEIIESQQLSDKQLVELSELLQMKERFDRMTVKFSKPGARLLKVDSEALCEASKKRLVLQRFQQLM